MADKMPGVATNEDTVLSISDEEFLAQNTVLRIYGDEDSYMAGANTKDGSAATDAGFKSHLRVELGSAAMDAGFESHHRVQTRIYGDEDSFIAGASTKRGSAKTDANFESHFRVQTDQADIDSGQHIGHHKIREVLNVTKPFDQTLVEQIGGDEDSYMAGSSTIFGGAKMDADFESHFRDRTPPADTDPGQQIGHHKIREALNLNVTKPFDQTLVEQIGGDEDSYMAGSIMISGCDEMDEIVGSAFMDAKFESGFPVQTDPADIDSGQHKIREVLSVTKPFDQKLVEQIGGDEESSLLLYHQLYSYATQGKIDRFKDTIEGKPEAGEVHHPNARVWLLSGLSPHSNTLLHIAASFGHAKLAAEILHHHNRLLFETNFDGDTALHIAAKARVLDTTNTLLREARGVDSDVSRLLNSINNEKNTPLHEALIHGRESVAKCLIEAHPDLRFDCNKERQSSLYLAAEGGYVDIVKLLKERVKPKTRVPGKSPLHGAILGRRKKGAGELLEIISSLEEMFESPTDEEDSPKDEKEDSLKDEGGESAKDEEEESATDEEESARDERESPKDQRTPLHCAASIGYMEGVRFLLERHHSDSHQVDHGGNFPIHSASSKGHVNIVKELLRHCPDSKEFRNSNGENILHVAARCGKDNLVKYFLKTAEFQMLINQKDSKGNTPLHLATVHHHPKVVYRLAWDTRTSIKLLNDRGMTALDITESTLETIETYHGRLTWMVLKSAFANPAQDLHILQWWRSPQVADNGGDHHEERFKYKKQRSTQVADNGGDHHEDRVKDSVNAQSLHGQRKKQRSPQVADNGGDHHEDRVKDSVNAQSLHGQRKKQRSPQVADSGGGHHEDRFKDRVNALLVVATLVATVAFAAGFTMPGGNNDSAPHKGMALLLTKAMFQAFVIFNTIAMYTAILVAVSLIWAQLGDVNLVYIALRLALPLLGTALTMMSLAFMAGVYVVVSNLHWLAYVVLILGAIFIFCIVVVFIPLSYNTASRFCILRRITYFLFCAEVWASGSHNDD